MDWVVIGTLATIVAATATAIQAWISWKKHRLESGQIRQSALSLKPIPTLPAPLFPTTHHQICPLPDSSLERATSPLLYGQLEILLATGRWLEANEETAKVMSQIARIEERRSLDLENINDFPCGDLQLIDHLWVKYSEGHFGFSVQKLIYQSLGGTKEYDKEIWRAFGNKIGWRISKEPMGNWLDYRCIIFDIKAPKAHLPWAVLAGRGFVAIFSRIETCKI